MNLYNALFGLNKRADLLLACLGWTRYDIPRFRDCIIRDNAILIYTRTGGENRQDYEGDIEILRSHPCFVTDMDDAFDCTYAYFIYNFPVDYAVELNALSKNDDTVIPGEKWKELLKCLEG